MAKAMLTRPHITAFCAYGTHLFRFQALHRIQSQPFARLILPVGNLGRQQLVNPTIHHIVGRRRVSTGVTSPSNGSGQIDSPLMQSMETKIKEQLNAELVTVNDAYGDGRHVSIDVVSSAFEGQSAVNRQRMVYKAIWEELQNVCAYSFLINADLSLMASYLYVQISSRYVDQLFQAAVSLKNAHICKICWLKSNLAIMLLLS